MAEGILIGRDVIDRVLAESQRAPEVECCGLLAGRDGVITHILPATNVLASATTFEITPEELFCMFKEMRAAGLEHLGIYHSHPRGMNIPSPTDVKRAFYPAAAYLIVSPLPNVTQPVRAFRIREGRFTELRIEIV
jgi:[CysO sulfur-carrier protein]-S-L-cysteine hydrolase